MLSLAVWNTQQYEGSSLIILILTEVSSVALMVGTVIVLSVFITVPVLMAAHCRSVWGWWSEMEDQRWLCVSAVSPLFLFLLSYNRENINMKRLEDIFNLFLLQLFSQCWQLKQQSVLWSLRACHGYPGYIISGPWEKKQLISYSSVIYDWIIPPWHGTTLSQQRRWPKA